MRALATLMMVGLTGCSLSEVAAYPDFDEPPDPRTFSLRTEGHSVVARVDARAISSADLNLGRYGRPDGSELRGTAFGKPVSLDVRAGEATGIIGGAPTNLTITREGSTLRLQGLVRGQISDFRLDHASAAGTIGACAYELARAGDVYEGRRSCRGPTEYVNLRMPATFARWRDEERAAALAILMGGTR
jgi:hypothetical protein